MKIIDNTLFSLMNLINTVRKKVKHEKSKRVIGEKKSVSFSVIQLKYVYASTFGTVQRCCADLHIIEHYGGLSKTARMVFNPLEAMSSDRSFMN